MAHTPLAIHYAAEQKHLDNQLKTYGMLKICRDCIFNEECPQYQAPGLIRFQCFKKVKRGKRERKNSDQG